MNYQTTPTTMTMDNTAAMISNIISITPGSKNFGPGGTPSWAARRRFPVNDLSSAGSRESLKNPSPPARTHKPVFEPIPNVTNKTKIIHTPTGDIEVKEMLGQGTFGQVYRAQDVAPSKHPRQYAIKVMPKGDPIAPAASLKIVEAVCHRAVSDHPNVVTLHHALQDEELVFFVMDYVEGGNLADRLDSVYAGELDTLGLCSDRGVKRVFTQILDAVAHCHDMGICHRDLKPENILVSDNGEVFLTDFGLSSSKEYSDSIVGSRAYMSPEVIEGRITSRMSSDVWSLGMILFELINKTRPWDGAYGANDSYRRFIQDSRVLYHGTWLSREAYHLFLRIFDEDEETRITLDELMQEIESMEIFFMDPQEKSRIAAMKVKTACEALLSELIAQKRRGLGLPAGTPKRKDKTRTAVRTNGPAPM